MKVTFWSTKELKNKEKMKASVCDWSILSTPPMVTAVSISPIILTNGCTIIRTLSGHIIITTLIISPLKVI